VGEIMQRAVALIDKPVEHLDYKPDLLPTIMQFHRSNAEIRAIIGPVGSGKTSAATWDMLYYIPIHLKRKYGIKRSRWAVVRNTFTMLEQTTMATIFYWFGYGNYEAQKHRYVLRLPKPDSDCTVEVLFMGCDRPQDIDRFKGLELTGYWIDESIEVDEDLKRILKQRIQRYPPKCPVRYGIETSNPPDIEHPTYWQYAWNVVPPGPMPERAPLLNHAGFWQPPYENVHNLPKNYYDNLARDYADNPDWVDMYILGKPGIIVRGRPVYQHFEKDYHFSGESLVWGGQPLYRGWDDSGNCPACVVVMPIGKGLHVLKEFHTEKDDITTFGKYVFRECASLFPGADYEDWGDPAGEQKFSKRGGGFTSNAELLRNECGIDVRSSEQNLTARIYSVQNLLYQRDGLLIDPSCTRLVNGFLGGYCYPEHRSIKGEYSPDILKNKFSHIHDALQYVAVQLFPSLPPSMKEPRTKKRITHLPDYDPLWRYH
jgi:hypothetical protein